MADSNEDVDTPLPFQGMTKKKIYDILSREYVLPSVQSRCITKKYMFAIYNKEFFSVTREELLRFESSLSLEETKKSSFFNVSLLTWRLDKYLHLEEKKPLGFSEDTQADEAWFSRILRYLDPYNVLGGFTCRVKGSLAPKHSAGRL